MERAIPNLPADDLSVAKEFYVSRLGFKVRFEATEDGRVGLLGVEDADAYHDEWRGQIEIRRAPKNEEWGARTFDVIDPFGNTLFVMGPVK